VRSQWPGVVAHRQAASCRRLALGVRRTPALLALASSEHGNAVRSSIQRSGPDGDPRDQLGRTQA
jgi:hypothetical protein